MHFCKPSGLQFFCQQYLIEPNELSSDRWLERIFDGRSITMWYLAYISKGTQRIDWHCCNKTLPFPPTYLWTSFLKVYIYKNKNGKKIHKNGNRNDGELLSYSVNN